MKKLVFALALLLGCQSPPDAAPATEAAARETASTEVAAPGTLVNRLWVRADSTGRPGVLQLFLADGTLLMDSCWETYRLSEWRRAPDGSLRWWEDGAEIHAEVLTLRAEELVLRLHLRSETVDQRFVPASVPYVCPDMPR